MALSLDGFDHVHVFVRDRARAQGWYGDVLGLRVSPELAHWADGGPLMLENEASTIRLALFEGDAGANRSVVAFRVDGEGLAAWKSRLEERLDAAPRLVDHGAAWSLYFSDPDGNPFEITTYDADAFERAVADG